MKTLFALFAATILLSSSQSLAADAFDFRSLGFSKDGQYFSFVQSVVQDGSGFPAALLQVVEVETSKIVKTNWALLDDEKATQEQAVQKAIVEGDLQSYGITPGQIPGRDLLIRLPTDHSKMKRIIFSSDFWSEGGASPVIPKYEITLATKSPPSSHCHGMAAPQLLSVSVVGREGTSGTGRTLLKDETFAHFRECAFGYGVRRVIANGKSIVIQIDFKSPSFEGSDIRQMVVSGKGIL